VLCGRWKTGILSGVYAGIGYGRKGAEWGEAQSHQGHRGRHSAEDDASAEGGEPPAGVMGVTLRDRINFSPNFPKG
jgi:hypothetical protein